MADQVVKYQNFPKGLVGRGVLPQAFPADALAVAENVRLADGGISTRAGIAEALIGPRQFILEETAPPLDGHWEYGAGAYDPTGNRAIFQGGYYNLGIGHYESAWWVYIEGSDVIADYLPTNWALMPGRELHTLTFDSTNRKMYVFGGLGAGPAVLSDLWVLDCATNVLTELTPLGGPIPARYDHVCVYDPINLCLWIHGGLDNTDTALADLWKYDIATNTLLEVSVVSGPEARSEHAATWDTENDCMWLHGGTNAAFDVLGDLWKFEPESTWTQVRATAGGASPNPGLRSGHSLVYFAVHKQVILVGGYTDPFDVPQDIWRYSPLDDVWVGSYSQDNAVADIAVACDSDAEKVAIFGGYYATIPYGLTISGYSGDPYGTVLVTQQARFPSSESSYIVCQIYNADDFNKLYVATDQLPATPEVSPSSNFAELYDLGLDAGTVSIAVLGDRAIITEGVNNGPLVFSGGLDATGDDWASPNTILVSYDGGTDAHYEDITQEVCDADPDNGVDIGGMTISGEVVIVCDVPEVEAFYFKMAVPNTGLGGAEAYTTTIPFADATYFDTLDLGDGLITNWVQDTPAAATGHFEGETVTLNDGEAAVDKGAGLVGLPSTDQPYTGGEIIEIRNSHANYTGTFTVDVTSSANEIVITAVYAAYTVGADETANRRLTLGVGNDCPLVEAGTRAKFASSWQGIISITDDGEADDEVTLENAVSSAAVTAIEGLMWDPSLGMCLSAGESAPLASIYTKLLNGVSAQFAGYSIRAIIAGADLVAGGRSPVLTTLTGNSAAICKRMSIVEQDSGANGTTTPTEIFTDNSSGWSGAARGAIAHDPISGYEIDALKNYLIIYDFDSYTETTTTPERTEIVTNPAYSAWLKAQPAIVTSTNPAYTLWQSQEPKWRYPTDPYEGFSWGYDPYDNNSFSTAFQAWAAAYNAWKAQQPAQTITDSSAYTTWLANEPAHTITQIIPATTTTATLGGSVATATTGSGYYYKTDTESWDDQTVTGFTPVTTGTVGVVSIYARGSAAVLPSGLMVGSTNSYSRANINFIESLVSMEATSSAADQFCAVSFDLLATLWIWDDTQWYEIVKFDSVWEYRDAGGAWQAATRNSMLGAWQEAAAIAINQMTPAELAAIVEAEWGDTNGFLAGLTTYTDMAWACQSTASSHPGVENFILGYSDIGSAYVEGYHDGIWTQGSGWTDATQAIAGVPLSQDGSISYSTGTFRGEYTVVNEVPGYIYKLTTQGTSDGTTITSIRYKAPVQPLATIGSGQPDYPLAFITNISNIIIDHARMGIVQDNVVNSLSAVVCNFSITSELCIGGLTQFSEIELTPLVPNAEIAAITLFYWDGTSKVAMTVTDGTSVGGACFATKGKIKFTAPDDWKECIPYQTSDPRGYYVWIMVSATLTATTSIAECRIYPVPEERPKYNYAVVAQNRLFLGKRTDGPAQWDMSRQLESYGFTGSESRADGEDVWGTTRGGLIAGAGGAIRGGLQAWNSLYSFGDNEIWQLLGDAAQDKYFGRIEAAGLVPHSPRVCVMAPMSANDGDRHALYFINQRGAYAVSAWLADQTYGAARVIELSNYIPWWKSEHDGERIDLNYLHLASGVAFPAEKQVVWSVPMIIPPATSQTTCNRLIVWNYGTQSWEGSYKFDVGGTEIGFASLCLAYDYNANAPGKLGGLRLYGGDYNGTVYEVFTGTDDSGTSITGIVETGWFGDEQIAARMTGLKCYGSQEADGSITVELYTDGNQTAITFDPAFTITNLDGLNGYDFADFFRYMDIKAHWFKLKFTFTGWVKDFWWSVALAADDDTME